VKFGLFAINYGTCGDPEAAIAAALHAEAAGFESVWTGEHIALPDPQPHESPFPPTLRFLDTTVALTLLATHTTTLKLASGIIVLPFRNPVLLAKELASIDVVAGGRLIVGLGAGYMREEFDAVGVSLTDRHERMDDDVGALRALWAMERPDYRGPYVSFHGIDAHPRPAQRPGPPLRSRVAVVVTVISSGPSSVVERYEGLGVNRLVLLPQPDADSDRKHRPVSLEQILRNVDWVAEKLL
jgi:alkanesulfonate monooxygenase SsuD/methylene tetrahydromethanopterin reductase-like flavin-dependent oxidoreductase (luciferase family)